MYEPPHVASYPSSIGSTVHETYQYSQFQLSERLARDYPDLAYGIFTEAVYRLEDAPMPMKKQMLQCMVPWIETMDFGKLSKSSITAQEAVIQRCSTSTHYPFIPCHPHPPHSHSLANLNVLTHCTHCASSLHFGLPTNLIKQFPPRDATTRREPPGPRAQAVDLCCAARPRERALRIRAPASHLRKEAKPGIRVSCEAHLDLHGTLRACDGCRLACHGGVTVANV